MNKHEILADDPQQHLRFAAKKATIRQVSFKRAKPMVAVRKRKNIASDDSDILDDADALIALAQESFTAAAKAAVAENDQLGIPTHGAERGKLVVRHPPKAGAPSQP